MRDYSLKKKGNFHHAYKKLYVRSILFVAGVFLVSYLLGSFVSGAVAVVLKPWYAVSSWASNGGGALPTYFRDRSSLHDEIARLNEELAGARLGHETESFLRAENDELRKLLAADTRENGERIAAGVIGRPPYTPYDTLFLDRGSEHGILEGAPVYHFNNRLIGFVGKVFETSSIVSLLSAPEFETTVYVYGPNIYTTAHGAGDGVISVRVPQNITLTEGDTVVAPTLAQGLIGTIGVIRSEASEPEQYGYVLPDSSLQSIRLVSVGTAPVTPVSFETARTYVSEGRETLFTIPVPAGVLVDEHASTTPSTATSTATTTSLE